MTETKTDILKGIYQIWYDDQTRKMCSDYFTPFHNPELTPFFENQVIYDLCSQGRHLESEWFGVLSPVFFSKAWRGGVRPTYMRERMSAETDLVSFHYSRNPNIILQGHSHHAKSKGNFKDIVQRVLRMSGIDWDVHNPLRFPVLMNYVVARDWVWDRYFNEMLEPCMDVMRDATGELKELIWQDAEYGKGRTQTMRRHLQATLGVPYYPMHTFILERLWSVWLEMNYDDVRKTRYKEV